MKPAPRKQLAKLGTHGRSVRVFVERGHQLVRVEWREGRRRTESWPNTPANRKVALAFAEGVAMRLARRGDPTPEPITIVEMFDRYVRVQSEHWRPNTRRLAIERWRKFQEFAGPSMRAHHVTPAMLDDFRLAMRERHAVNQIVEHIKVVKAVYRWARTGKLIAENPIAEYTMRLSKEERRLPTHEYTPEECAAILARADYRNRKRWRLWVALTLVSTLGPRQRALRYLRWDSDVDMAERTVRWRPELDKVGHDRVQPLPRDAVFALRVARYWRRKEGYTGPYVLPPVQERRRVRDEPWTYQAMQQALHTCADEAGVRRIKFRALHGFRRMVITSLEPRVGLLEAGRWVGQTDLRTMQKYHKAREVRQREIAAIVERPK